MYILPNIKESEHNRTVQKLHVREVMEFIIDADQDKQIQLIKMLSVELKLMPVSKAKDILALDNYSISCIPTLENYTHSSSLTLENYSITAIRVAVVVPPYRNSSVGFLSLENYSD